MWGMGDAMRRRSILRIGRALVDKDPETTSLLDVGCGTGRFLTFVKVGEKVPKPFFESTLATRRSAGFWRNKGRLHVRGSRLY